MKPIKLTSMLLMLLVAATAFGQGEFYDDVYFPSGKKVKKEQKEVKKVIEPQKQTQRTVTANNADLSSVNVKSGLTEDEVDAYNRRNLKDNEELTYEDEGLYAEDDTVVVDERRSDTEYSERIIRYHSPSKVTIAGADNVNIYLSDGYYGYGYETEYSDAGSNVNFNINVGNSWGWGSPWYGGYSSWYDPWYYSPWSYNSWYGPSWGWGGFYSPWYYSSWYGPSWGWGGSYWGGYGGYYGGYYGHSYGGYYGGGGYYSSPSRHYPNGRATTGRIMSGRSSRSSVSGSDMGLRSSSRSSSARSSVRSDRSESILNNR